MACTLRTRWQRWEPTWRSSRIYVRESTSAFDSVDKGAARSRGRASRGTYKRQSLGSSPFDSDSGAATLSTYCECEQGPIVMYLTGCDSDATTKTSFDDLSKFVVSYRRRTKGQVVMRCKAAATRIFYRDDVFRAAFWSP